MNCKLEKNKCYAIALEGGGARGAYEVGVWKALEEAGIQYNAVSGTSVGALNGGLMAMRDLPRAIEAWESMELSKVMELDQEQEETMKRLLSGEAELSDIQSLLPHAVEIIKNRGLDVSPLRAWVREVIDEQKIKDSDVELFVTTVSLSDKKSLELKVNDLPVEDICDMLLASAYHPSFRLEKLGGKFYTDGGFVDALPLHALVSRGYKDIIAVRLPGLGVEKLFRIPDDVSITYISPDCDLGNVLNFTAEQARQNLQIGYLDAQRVLYGLSGKRFYLRRSLSDRQALDFLLDQAGKQNTLRSFLEKEIPRLFRRLDAEGDYYELLIALLEEAAFAMGSDPLRIHDDTELLSRCRDQIAELLDSYSVS